MSPSPTGVTPEPMPPVVVPVRPAPTVLSPTPVPVEVIPTVPVAPASPPILVAPVSDVSSAEQAVIDLTNVQRSQYGLAPLARDETIMGIARQRVEDMLTRGYFSHYDPVTGAHLAREAIMASGYSRVGENIYRGGSADLSGFPQRVTSWFMSDQPHAASILSTSYTRIGVGVGWDGSGWMAVQDFAAP